VSSQNRMNAGAEYVVYRIWAALQGQKGIHAESLIICLGALAGYACQVSVRQNAALPGADLRKHALMAVDASDGTTHFHGDALNLPLIQSPLSVWALVSRTVEKLGEPLPDIDDIASHVTETLGTRAFGSPRVSAGHGPRRPAVVYLRQVWPQIFPIAQRFCRKPAEMPVLFGIALQRAIEATRDVLDPTLSASIAMECAVAMSKVVLPEDYSDPAIAWSSVIAKERNAAPRVLATRAHESRSEPLRARVPPVRKRKDAVGAETATPRVGTLIANLPRAARVATFVSLAIVAVAAVVYEGRGLAKPAQPPARHPGKLRCQVRCRCFRCGGLKRLCPKCLRRWPCPTSRCRSRRPSSNSQPRENLTHSAKPLRNLPISSTRAASPSRPPTAATRS
jgi:hypothetical protein